VSLPRYYQIEASGLQYLLAHAGPASMHGGVEGTVNTRGFLHHRTESDLPVSRPARFDGASDAI
jgi:hypothetical protein